MKLCPTPPDWLTVNRRSMRGGSSILFTSSRVVDCFRLSLLADWQHLPLKNSTTCISSKDKEIKSCPLETQTARQRASVSVEGLPSPTVPVRCAADYKVGNKVTPSARFHAGSNYKTSRHGRAIQNASRIWESPYWKLPHIPTISPFSQKAIPSRPAAGVIGSVTSISTSCRIRVSSDIDGEHSLDQVRRASLGLRFGR